MTLKIDVHTPDGKKNGSVELPAELFDAEPNIALMHQVVNAQLAEPREKYAELMQNPAYIEKVLKEGAEKARAYSRPFLERIRESVGIRSLTA